MEKKIVNGCKGCPMYNPDDSNGELYGNVDLWCNHPAGSYGETIADLFKKCPLKNGSITIELNQSENEG